MSYSSESFNLAELQLEQELRQMFEVDSQKDLETYLTCVQELQEQSWTADIQTMYRAIHTIKGGSVTVKAEAILQVATVLEDMLSELRYLETIPSLEDGCLKQFLEEAGEIIASVFSDLEYQEEAVRVKVARIENIKQQIKANYLADWNEQTQLQIEFAEQGFDLVILDLEVAINNLAETEIVPNKTIELAKQLIEELEQIGLELEFASGWTALLESASELINRPDASFWKVRWLQYFSDLKIAAKQGGQFTFTSEESDLNLSDRFFKEIDLFQDGEDKNSKFVEENLDLDAVDNLLNRINLLENSSDREFVSIEENSDLDAVDSILDEINLLENSSDREFVFIEDNLDLDAVDNLLDEINLLEDNSDRELVFIKENLDLDTVDNLLDEIDLLEDSEDKQSKFVEETLDLEGVDKLLDGINLLEDSEYGNSEFVRENSDLDTVDSILDNINLLEVKNTQTINQNTKRLFEKSSLLDQSLLNSPSSENFELFASENEESEKKKITNKVAESTFQKPSNLAKEILVSHKTNRSQKSNSSETEAIKTIPGTFPKFKTNSLDDIQVPIPLTKLDKSARSIVDILMITRTMESFYQTLYQDLLKLTGIAKDSVQYLAQLRQIQNDYTLLNQLDKQLAHNTDTPTLERYRTGYITINRLLENNLRLSEIGTEAEQTARETTDKLKQLSKSIAQLKDLVEDSRLIPFKNLTFRVKAIVRDLMTRYGKLINLNIQGEQIELDVGTTRRLEPILLHLVRNAYDHGLETPTERTIQGKSEQGNLNLILQRYGNTYTLQLQDDGRGINSKTIQAKAEKLNLPLTRTDTPSELLAVICQAGFSSRTEVSEVSGRGVGMDVVAEQILLLNGSLSLETILGKGTTFKLNFPVPHLLIPCLLVGSGDRVFAIPTEQIITTSVWENLPATPNHNSEFLGTWEIEEGEQRTVGLDLLSYWDPKFGQRTLNRSAIAVLVQAQLESQSESESERSAFWLLADKMLGKLELKIQPFPTPLIAPQGIMGVSLQTDISLIPVIEVNSLYINITTKLSSLNTTQSTVKNNQWQVTQQKSQTILIVDDAALMRRRIEASLSANGFTTHTCADGLEAWNWLKINPQPMLIITDIEMPNMDGFTLINRCRDNKMTFPILVISSRLAEEWSKEARRLGATDFLTKGFATGELINMVNSLVS
jgi:chemotaxis protein histidine kinase CheA/CheY-like chemotaxis protein